MRAIGLLLMLFADRFRGHADGDIEKLQRKNFGDWLHWFVHMQQAKRMMEALAMTLCVGVAGTDLLWVWAALWVGICLGGYGNAIGPALDGVKPARARTANNRGPQWWQRGELLDDAWTSLVMVGVIWGLPATVVGVCLGHFNMLATVPVLSFSFVASCYLARHLFNGSWAIQQWIFGPLVGLLFYLA